MIYTITFNPALDYIVNLDEFKEGLVNRTKNESIFPGGKGINVSIVLNNLGVKNKALGYIAGFTGEEIERSLKEYGCETDFIRLKEGNSRINVKIKADKESEINGNGPKINEEEIEEIYIKLCELKNNDILVLAGSIPSTLPNNIYEKIMEKLGHNDVKIIVDATGEILLNTLRFKPFLIKPNHHELQEIFNVKLDNDEDIIKYAKKLRTMGAQNVIVSMADRGAILVDKSNEVIKMEAPSGIVKNSVGAGDSMVAGFIFGYLKNKKIQEAFKLGVITGSASAFSQGLATIKKVESLLEENDYH